MLPNHFLVVARNQHPMPESVQKIAYAHGKKAGKHGEDLLVALALRNDLSQEVDKLIGESSSARVFRTWVMRPTRTIEEKTMILAEEKRPTILAALAKDPETPVELLELLTGKMTDRIATALFHNPQAPHHLLIEAADILDPGSVDGSFPKHAEVRIRETPKMHEALGQVCKLRTASFIVGSPELSEEVRTKLVKEVLLPITKDQLPPNDQSRSYQRHSKAWYYEERQAFLHKTVQDSLALNHYTLEDAKMLLKALKEAPSTRRENNYRIRATLEKLHLYISEREQEGFQPGEEALIARAASAEGAELDRVLEGVYNLVNNWELGKDDLLEKISAALHENPAMTGQKLYEYCTRADRYVARKFMMRRLTEGRKEDLGVMLKLFDLGIVGTDTIVPAVKSNPSILLKLLTEAHKPASQRNDGRRRGQGDRRHQIIKALLSAQLVPVKWILTLEEDDLKRFMNYPGAESVYAQALLQELGENLSAWEVFNETVKHGGTLKERLWAARAL